MSRKMAQYSAEFKTKIVLEVLKGDKTINEIASEYNITQLSHVKFIKNISKTRKKQLLCIIVSSLLTSMWFDME